MPSNSAVPFTDQLKIFAQSLTDTFSLPFPGQPEDQLKAPIGQLLRYAGELLGNTNVSVKYEATMVGVGRPDLAVGCSGLLCGHVELKAPGKGATPTRYTGHDRAQWLKFRDLPNLVYTDGNDFSLYRKGQRVGGVRLSGDVTTDGAAATSEEDGGRLANLLRDFLSWQPIVPQSPKALAEMLAPLCHLLRDDVLSALADSDSNLSNLAEDWRAFLLYKTTSASGRLSGTTTKSLFGKGEG